MVVMGSFTRRRFLIANCAVTAPLLRRGKASRAVRPTVSRLARRRNRWSYVEGWPSRRKLGLRGLRSLPESLITMLPNACSVNRETCVASQRSNAERYNLVRLPGTRQ